MGLLASTGAGSGLRLFDSTGGVQVRRIRADERDRLVALEVAAFGDDPATARAWLAPQFGVAGFDHWVAEIAGATVGSAASVRSDELAGPAVMITGMAALPGADAGLVKAQLSAQISAEAVPAGPGAMLVHVYPMTMRRPPRSRPLGSSRSPASWSGSSSQPDHCSSPSPPPGSGSSYYATCGPWRYHNQALGTLGAGVRNVLGTVIVEAGSRRSE
jgi:hypothetical protein